MCFAQTQLLTQVMLEWQRSLGGRSAAWARVPDRPRSDGLRHGERADHPLETPPAIAWVWVCFSDAPSVANFAGGMIVMAAVVGHVWHSDRSKLVAT
jgi:hypothetical protein